MSEISEQDDFELIYFRIVKGCVTQYERRHGVAMIELPKNIKFNRRIPKQKFYENILVSSSLKCMIIDRNKAIY